MYKSLLEKKNVVGVGIGLKNYNPRVKVEDQTPSVVTMVRKKERLEVLNAHDVVPETVGVQLDNQDVALLPTDVVETGEFVAQASDRVRPAEGGCSIGHYKITAGTLGCAVYDAATGEKLILSNNHVLANSNNASKGDAILQPGPYDGGTIPNDVIGHLKRYIELSFVNDQDCNIANAAVELNNAIAKAVGSSKRLAVEGTMKFSIPNLVDAAVASIKDGHDVLDHIRDIGEVQGISSPSLGILVYKHGRTTNYTESSVQVVGATVDVNYGDGKIARFENQIVSGDLSRGGDSGSLVLTEGNRAVGLLFAGSSTHTIMNPIEEVMSLLDIEFGFQQ